jgi:UDP-glucose 4-epimerase
MRYLVIGGAGYIGSHFVLEAMRQGHECHVFDNFSRGHRQAVPKNVRLTEADLLDDQALRSLLAQKPSFDAIFHFAAFALVGESVAQPDIYYRNNTEGVRILLDAMRDLCPETVLVFSSTCAVFGVPENLPIAEDDRKQPMSPYGRSKLMAEWMMEDYAKAYGLRALALRYFNACGADSSGTIGEDHEPETHLIPNIIRQSLRGETLTIFGSDFPTQDGTCVRDYIHVTDLADAHIRAAGYLVKQKKSFFDAIHLGTGNGYSNLEIVDAAGKVLDKKLSYKFGDRRPGDPPALFANNRKARELLNFEPRFSDLKTILSSALMWHQKRPDGFK